MATITFSPGVYVIIMFSHELNSLKSCLWPQWPTKRMLEESMAEWNGSGPLEFSSDCGFHSSVMLVFIVLISIV